MTTGEDGEICLVSIHAPRAGRDDGFAFRVKIQAVSIHAPRAGRDAMACRRRRCARFQSTRPARGATGRLPDYGSQCLVSIHAPRAGRDVQPEVNASDPRVSIHAPRAGRDVRHQPNVLEDEMFQSTRPARGATREAASSRTGATVSIHAPRAGRDSRAHAPLALWPCFNPRAPRGARLEAGPLSRPATWFQSTRPARGATRILFCSSSRRCVSIHAPRAGRDQTAQACHLRPHVSIHAPRAGRDHFGRTPATLRRVSIHAPRAGRDIDQRNDSADSAVSIHAPRAGRDSPPAASPRCTSVSIHAPRAGRDRVRLNQLSRLSLHSTFREPIPAQAAAHPQTIRE